MIIFLTRPLSTPQSTTENWGHLGTMLIQSMKTKVRPFVTAVLSGHVFTISIPLRQSSSRLK